ncbi:type II CAAX prenyl endopeptidase Rce1 family protein [Castellaniella sp.]|uniref:CPBP family glutamic-type intramembrane protease n=1 Tax=Castellaniella sp. TaxID=1955812 RepID=UPI00355D765E
MLGLARPAGLPTMGQEIADFLRFVRRPGLGPRTGARPAGSCLPVDFALGAPWWRILHWAILLWTLNIFVFAPLALSAATALGAEHRLNIHQLPWLTAMVWAPIVEELTFRYALRRPAMVWWFVPLMVAVLVQGPAPASALLGCAALLLILAPRWYRSGHRWQGGWRLSWAARRRYRRWFPVLFHAAAIAFAAVHLFNFRLSTISWVVLPLLVLPQWVTGLVLGWLRVRRGVGAAIGLHAVFNGGPLLLIALVLYFFPELAVQ